MIECSKRCPINIESATVPPQLGNKVVSGSVSKWKNGGYQVVGRFRHGNGSPQARYVRLEDAQSLHVSHSYPFTYTPRYTFTDKPMERRRFSNNRTTQSRSRYSGIRTVSLHGLLCQQCLRRVFGLLYTPMNIINRTKCGSCSNATLPINQLRRTQT